MRRGAFWRVYAIDDTSSLTEALAEVRRQRAWLARSKMPEETKRLLDDRYALSEREFTLLLSGMDPVRVLSLVYGVAGDPDQGR